MRILSAFLSLLLIPLLIVAAEAQQQPAPQASPSPAQEKKAPQMQSPAARLTSAKNVLIVRLRGSEIPYDTIRTTIEDWNRFTLVSDPEKADLIIEVASVGGEADMRVSGGTTFSPQSGKMETSSKSSKDLSATEITMTVSDARNKRVLWRAAETSKYAMRQKSRENNLVEAAERLASKFHDRLEPPMVR